MILAVVSGVDLLLRRRALLAVAAVATGAGGLGLIAPVMVVVYCHVIRGRVWVAAACTVAAFTVNIVLAPPIRLLKRYALTALTPAVHPHPHGGPEQGVGHRVGTTVEADHRGARRHRAGHPERHRVRMRG